MESKGLNAGTPINGLPMELLAEIFLYVKASGRPPIYNARWRDVLRVCRHWFVVGTGTPRLWSQILVGRSLDDLHNSLARSQGIPVDVCLLPYGIAHGLPLTCVVPIIAPHVHRLQCIRLDTIPIHQITEAFAFLQAHSFPILQDLTACAACTYSGQPLQLEPDRFPSLRELRVAYLNVFSAAIISQLSTLHVAAYGGGDTAFDLDALLDVLATLQNIEDLALFRIIVSNTTITRPPSFPKVELKKLRKLTMVLNAPVLKRLLEDLVIPSSAKVTLCSLYAESRYPGMISDYLPDDKSTLPILSKLTVAHVHALSHDHSFEGSIVPSEDGLMPADSCIHLSVTLQAPSRGSVRQSILPADAVLTILQWTPQVEVLHVKISPVLSLGATWWTAFSRIPRLRELRISVTMADGELASPLDRIFVAFDATPRTMTWEVSQAYKFPIMCPELRCLRFVGNWRWTDNVLENIVSFLNRRRNIFGKEVVLEELWIDMYRGGWDGYYEERKRMLEDSMSLSVTRVVVAADWSPEDLE